MLEGPAAPGRAQGAGRPHLVTDLIGSAREDALAVGRLVIEGVQVPAVAKSAMANASVLASAVVDAVKASRGAANLNDIAQLRELAVAFFTHAQTCETAFHTIVAPLNVAADALFDIALKHEMRTDARRLDEQTKGVATALVAAVTPDRMRASAAESHRGVPV